MKKLNMSPLRKIVKIKLLQIYIKFKSVIISIICGNFFHQFQMYIFGVDLQLFNQRENRKSQKKNLPLHF
jgi:hypothetical protein